MQLSTSKTHYKLFYNIYIKKKEPNVIKVPKLYLYDKLLQYTDKPVKYLGFYLSYNLNYTYHINSKIKKASYALNTIRNGLRKIKQVKSIVIFSIIKACVIPIIHYGSIIMTNLTKKEIKLYDIFHHKILRCLTGLRYHTPTEALYLFSGQLPITYQIHINITTYWNRNLHITSNNPLYNLINHKWYFIWKNKYINIMNI